MITQKTKIINIHPKEEFYQIYDDEQAIDIINNIEISKEIPDKYIYFNGGAKYWDVYVKLNLEEDANHNFVKSNIDLLELDKEYILSLIAKGEKVNIFDIGAGNGYTAKPLLDELHSKGLLEKYIALDYSPSMLNIVESNIKEWFKDTIAFEKKVLDISNENFKNLLFRNSKFYGKNENVKNIVLFLGGTIENFRDEDKSLHNIKASLGKDDIFVLTRSLDSEKSRKLFDFYTDSAKEKYDVDLNDWDRWFVTLLNLKKEYYDFEYDYDLKLKCRRIQIVLKENINIIFERKGFNKHILLSKGDKILTWRHRHHSYKEIVDEIIDIGFNILHTSTSREELQLNVISKLGNSSLI